MISYKSHQPDGFAFRISFSPKRARFDEKTYEILKFTKQHAPKPSALSKSPSFALPPVTNSRLPSFALLAAKRKRDDNDDDEKGDESAELEVAPEIAKGRTKVSRTSMTLENPLERRNTMPVFMKFASPDKQPSLKHKSPQASASTPRVIFEIDDSDSGDEAESQSPFRSLSPELPEISPAISPRKAVPKVDVKGKGRAVEPSMTIDTEKPRPFPLEAAFHSLDELAHWPDRQTRPPYSLWVLIRCAILGSGINELTIDSILLRICKKYPYYNDQAMKSTEERNKLETTLKAAISSKQCFIINRMDRTNVRYSVDKQINPILKRAPAGKKSEKESEAASTKKGQSSPKLPAGAGLPKVKSQTLPIKPPPPPKKPQYEEVQPEKVPSADLDIFATSLLDLKNATHPDDDAEAAILTRAKQNTANTADSVPSARGGHIAVLRKSIPYDFWVPLRAAILGSPFRKLRMKQIMEDLIWKYP